MSLKKLLRIYKIIQRGKNKGMYKGLLTYLDEIFDMIKAYNDVSMSDMDNNKKVMLVYSMLNNLSKKLWE